MIKLDAAGMTVAEALTKALTMLPFPPVNTLLKLKPCYFTDLMVSDPLSGFLVARTSELAVTEEEQGLYQGGKQVVQMTFV